MSNTNPMYFVFIILAGFILPMLLIPIVAVTGYSEVVEESVKALVVVYLIAKLASTKSKILAAVLFGLLFGLSESMLYLTNILQVGDMNVFVYRLMFTMPMHTATVLLMTLATLRVRWYILFGLVNAIILHLIFNNYIINLI